MSDAPPRLIETPSGVRLCALEALPDGAARNFVLEMRAGRFFGFVVRNGDGVAGFVDRCPHMGLPLTQVLDQYLSPAGDLIVCSWHGAVFDRATGLCLSGPCAGQALRRWPVRVLHGFLVTGEM